jgi:putative ABC transport system permease protein
MAGFLNDLRIALRTIGKRPGFVLVIVLTLALGIGANTAIFGVVNAYLLRPLPFPDAGRLVALEDRQPPADLTPASFPEFEDWRKGNQVFDFVAGRFVHSLNLIGRHDPVRVRAALVSQDFFPMLRVHPVLGRTFTAAEHKTGAAAVAVISTELWQHEFGGDPHAIGQSITLDRTPYTVIGIVGERQLRFGSPKVTDLWIPLERDVPWRQRGVHFLTVIARLKPGVTLDRAAQSLKVLAAQLDAQYKTGHSIVASPLQANLFGETRASLLILLGAAGLLLVIACVNVANILLARATARGKEFALRAALGAGRWRLIRQTLAESFLLTGAGAAAGYLLALWGSALIEKSWPSSMARPASFDADWRVFAFLLGVTIASAILFGLAPALQVSPSSLQEFLKDGWNQTSGAGSRNGLRSGLAAGEVAVASVLLIGAGLLIESLWRVMQVDPGFHAENVLTMSISLPSAKYREDPQLIGFYDGLIGRLRNLPQTVAAGAIVNLPLGDGGMNGDFAIEGVTFPPNQEPIAEKYIVTPGYFRAMGVRLLRGRFFTEQDGRGGADVIIIGESVARKFWPNQSPLGKRVNIQFGHSDRKGWQEVVGVVPDVKRDGLDMAAGFELYIPFTQAPTNGMTLVIRSTGDPATLAAAARAQVLAIDREQPVYGVQTMQQVVADSLSGRRMSTGLLAAFAGLAVLLALIGIYGVVSYWVSQRTREMGIRAALGADPGHIVRLVLARGLIVTGAGIVVGLLSSLALSRLLASLLFEVKPHDLRTMAAVPLVLGVVALTACLIPARRAARVDPMVALRSE